MSVFEFALQHCYTALFSGCHVLAPYTANAFLNLYTSKALCALCVCYAKGGTCRQPTTEFLAAELLHTNV
jgi:hypothetical protein